MRVEVDGDEVARLPRPTVESPRQEVSLSVEGHQLLAVAEARNRGELLIYDPPAPELGLEVERHDGRLLLEAGPTPRAGRST